MKKYYNSIDYQNYLKFSETFSSVPFIQSLSSVKYLKDMDWISKDAVFVNGLSGDFISGGHAEIENIENNKLSSLDKKKRKYFKSINKKTFFFMGLFKK